MHDDVICVAALTYQSFSSFVMFCLLRQFESDGVKGQLKWNSGVRASKLGIVLQGSEMVLEVGGSNDKESPRLIQCDLCCNGWLCCKRKSAFL